MNCRLPTSTATRQSRCNADSALLRCRGCERIQCWRHHLAKSWSRIHNSKRRSRTISCYAQSILLQRRQASTQGSTTMTKCIAVRQDSTSKSRAVLRETELVHTSRASHNRKATRIHRRTCSRCRCKMLRKRTWRSVTSYRSKRVYFQRTRLYNRNSPIICNSSTSK